MSQLEEMARKAFSELEKFNKEMERFPEEDAAVTLDPDTHLLLSEDRKQRQYINSLTTQRGFYTNCCVLGKESFSSGRFYYEVQVGEE